MQNAEFLQFGQIHRNTFINSPKILVETLATRKTAAILCRPDHRRRGLCRVRRDRLLAGLNAVRVLRISLYWLRRRHPRSARCAGTYQR